MAEITGKRIHELPEMTTINITQDGDARFIIDVDDNDEGTQSVKLSTIIGALSEGKESVSWDLVTGKPEGLEDITESLNQIASSLDNKVSSDNFSSQVESIITTSLAPNGSINKAIADAGYATVNNDAGATVDNFTTWSAYKIKTEVEKCNIDDNAGSAADSTKTWSANKIKTEIEAGGKIKEVNSSAELKASTENGIVAVSHKTKSELSAATVTKGENNTTSTSSFKVPKVQINDYGHVVGLDESTITVPYPSAATTTSSGLMSAEDKAALNKLKTLLGKTLVQPTYSSGTLELTSFNVEA